ncbi:MAG: CPBP family intramembrane metalloprotease [Gemmatimonadaceae bacterium]|nr:CPBP family intramembrane metalloprotease [Chitinophagaceae bacterium]
MFEYKESREIGPAAAFFILMGLFIAGVVIGSMMGGVVWMGLTGRKLTTLMKDLSNPQYANAARIMQLVSVFFTLLVPSIVGAIVVNRKPFKWLGFTQSVNIRQVGVALLILFACMPVVAALTELNAAIPISKSLESTFKEWESSYETQVQAMATINTVGEFIFSLLILALVPAIFEEAFFRGSLQQILQKWFKSPIWAIVVASIIFSVIHFSYYGFLARFGLGVVLGLLFYYSKSLWPSIIAHFLNNAFLVSYMYYLSRQGILIKNIKEPSAPIWIGIPALLVVIVLMRYYKRISEQRLPPPQQSEHSLF